MKKVLVTTLLLGFVFFTDSFAQLSYGGGVGYTFLLNDDITTPISEGGLGLGAELHYGAKLRFGIPLSPFSITASAYWCNMESDGTYDDVSIDYSQTMLTISGGAEMSLLPGPIKPFIAADFLYTKWNDGEINYSYGSISGSETVEGDTRTGLGVGVGAKFTLLPLIDIELVAKYNMHNLFSKEDGEDDYNSYTITANIMF